MTLCEYQSSASIPYKVLCGGDYLPCMSCISIDFKDEPCDKSWKCCHGFAIDDMHIHTAQCSVVMCGTFNQMSDVWPGVPMVSSTKSETPQNAAIVPFCRLVCRAPFDE